MVEKAACGNSTQDSEKIPSLQLAHKDYQIADLLQ